MTKPHRKSNARVTGIDGSMADGRAPVRQCAATRNRGSADELLRFAVGPDGVIVPDVSGKLPGRGVWLTPERQAVDLAIRTGALVRGFKTKGVTVPDNLADQAATLLLHRVTGLLGLAKKAGEAVLGFDQVREAVQKRRPGLLFEAYDGAEDGRRKVYFLAKALYSGVEVAGALHSAELGMAFGRERVVHGLVREGRIAESLKTAYRRLCGFRERPELDWFPDQDR